MDLLGSSFKEVETSIKNMGEKGMDAVSSQVKSLTKNMDKARITTNSAGEAFQNLGVDILDGTGALRSNEAVFYEIIDALGQIDNDTERDALSMEIFGKSAQDLNSLIAQGADGLAAFAQEARDMGYVLTEEDLEALGAADDSFQRLKLTSEAIKNQFGLALAPAAEDLSYRLLDLSEKVDWDAFADRVGRAADAVINFLDWVVTHGDEVESTAETIGKGLEFLSSATPFGEFIEGAKWLSIGIEELGARTEKPRQLITDLFSDTEADGEQIAADAYDWGADMMLQMADGILANVSPVYSSVRFVAGIIADYLHFSVPEKGPLADLDKSPKDMVEMYAKGLDANAWRLDDAAAALAGDLSAELSVPTLPAAGRGGAYNYGGFVINVYGAEGQDEEALADAVMDRIQGAIDAREAVFA